MDRCVHKSTLVGEQRKENAASGDAACNWLVTKQAGWRTFTMEPGVGEGSRGSAEICAGAPAPAGTQCDTRCVAEIGRVRRAYRTRYSPARRPRSMMGSGTRDGAASQTGKRITESRVGSLKKYDNGGRHVKVRIIDVVLAPMKRMALFELWATNVAHV